MGMKLISRTPTMTAAEIAEAEAARTRAEVERARALAELQREQAAADRAAAAEARQAAEAERRRRAEQRRTDRAARRARAAATLASLRTVAPLLVVNAATVGAQGVYAYSETPTEWPAPVRVACAVIYALAAETIALYVGWHAHDALLQKAYATAARLRRASYLIASVFGALNYSHFAGERMAPTAFAVALGTLSLLSPWLWGLHTRRAQHVQLLREDLVDETGAVFDPARRRAFPFRSWAARRWSIDHNERDPRRAWEGYNRERAARRRQQPTSRIRAAVTVLRGRPLAAAEPAGLDTVAPDVRALCDAVLAQAKGARANLTMGAAATVMATPMAMPVASRPARTGQPVGHQPDHADGHDDDDLLAIVMATQEPRPVATRMAITSGHQMATTTGQPGPAPVANDVATTVAASKATPTANRVTTRVAKPSSSHDQIRRLAKRKNITEAEIAKEAGVSVSTVRRVLGKKK